MTAAVGRSAAAYSSFSHFYGALGVVALDLTSEENTESLKIAVRTFWRFRVALVAL